MRRTHRDRGRDPNRWTQPRLEKNVNSAVGNLSPREFEMDDVVWDSESRQRKWETNR